MMQVIQLIECVLACVNNEGEGLSTNRDTGNVAEFFVGSSDRSRGFDNLGRLSKVCSARLVSSDSLLPVGRRLDAREWKGDYRSFSCASGSSETSSKECGNRSDSQGETSHSLEIGAVELVSLTPFVDP